MELFDLSNWPNFFKAIENQNIENAFIDQIVIDSRRICSENSLFIALEGERQDGHRFIPHAASLGARFAIVKKDYIPPEEMAPITLLRVHSPLKSLQEIATVYRMMHPIPIVAIAGSYGKTMAKDLLQALVGTSLSSYASPESFNSQIGVPLSLLNINNKHQIAFIEAGISKTGEMDVLADIIQPNFAIITPVKETHLSTLKNLTTIVQQKIKLAEKLPETGWILASSEISLESGFQNLKIEKIFWNQNSPLLPHVHLLFLNQEEMGYQISFPDGNIFTKIMPYGLPFMIDLFNICIKAAWLFKIPRENLIEVLESYVPETMQTEVWTSPQGVTFINDTYSADPISIGKALKNLPSVSSDAKRIFFFDGFKNPSLTTEHDFRHIGEEICRAQINQLILSGNSDFSPLIKKVSQQSPTTEITLFADRKSAFKQMRERIRKDDLVLIKGSRKENLNDLAKELNDIVKDNRLIINLAAIRSNIEMIRTKITNPTRIMAMVKALAYGTDQIIIGKFLKQCGIDILGVAHVDEGITLRTGGIQQDIFVINAALYELTKLVKYCFEVGVSDLNLVHQLSKEALRQGKKIKVHLHVDTGMSRLGCRPEEAIELAQAIVKDPNLELEGLMTHFSSAEKPEDDEFTFKQIHVFHKVLKQLNQQSIYPKWVHASNSSGTLRFDLSFCNMVRIGLALYGLQSSQATSDALKLRMALCLKSKIAGINNCVKGDSISYGRTYVVKNKIEKIGVIPLGYFDGIHRHYSGKGYVLVRGKKAPMIGTICMDFMMVNITEIPETRVGDGVLLFGEDEYSNFIAPEEFAIRGNTNAHELITCLGPRIQRLFVDDEK